MPNIKVVSTDDYRGAVAAVERYIEGIRLGKWGPIRQAFHEDATMHGYYGKDLSGGSFNDLKDYIEKNGGSPNLKTRIDILAITPTSAVAQVDMEGAGPGSQYTDFHSLLKFDGQWKILAKTFHLYD